VALEVKRNEKEELKLSVSLRAIKELGLVYRSQLDVLRELIQNAVDAGASTIRINYDESARQLVVEHDGAPIEGEYLDAFLTVGTDFKAKKSDQYIGFFGIGRLSWLLVGHTAEIITGRYRLIWKEDTIDTIKKEELSDYYKGVKWIIHLRDDIKIGTDDIRRYIIDNYHGNVPIYVNGERVVSLIGYGKLLYSDEHNEVYLVKKSYGVVVKGIFTVDTDYELKSLLIRTSDPRVKINPARGLIWDNDYSEWRREVAKKALDALISKHTASELYQSIDIYDLASLTETAFPAWYSDNQKNKEMYRERIKHLVFKTADNRYVKGSEIDPEHWVYTTLDVTDTSVQKLARRGIYIIYARPSKIEDWLKEAGFRSISDVIVEEEAKQVSAEDLEEKLNSVYREVMEIVRSSALTLKLTDTQRITVNGVTYTVAVKEMADAVEIEFISSSPVGERPEKISAVQVKIVGKFKNIDVALVDYPDESVVAFTDGSKIYVNINNQRVKEIIRETKRTRSEWKLLLLWAPILAHEMIHMRGYDHTDPEWHRIYEDIIMKINKKVIEALSRSRRREL